MGSLLNDFFRAVENNHPDTVLKIIRSAGFDPNAYNDRGQTALHVAAKVNAVKVAHLLLENGAHARREVAPEKPMHVQRVA